MFKNMFLAAALLLLATLLQDTHACSFQDPPPSTEDIYNAHDLVFAGNILRVDTPEDQFNDKNVTIEITRIWKQADSDNLSVKDPITIYTAANDALCGIMPNSGESWIIFSGSSRRASNAESTLSAETLNGELNTVSPPPAEQQEDDTAACENVNDSCVNDTDCCGTAYCHANNKCKAVKFSTGHGNNRYLRSLSAH